MHHILALVAPRLRLRGARNAPSPTPASGCETAILWSAGAFSRLRRGSRPPSPAFDFHPGRVWYRKVLFALLMIATHIKSQLMSGPEIDRLLVQLAHEIVENTDRTGKLVIAGIHRRGAVLGQRIAEKMRTLAARDFPVGTLDITLYRDDLSTLAQDPVLNGADIPFPLEEKDVIIVDDVLYTGRTSLAALKALLDLGRPRTVRLCVLIDRGHRELPLEARFVGRRVETSALEIIEVQVASIDGQERVLLVERGSAA